MFFFTLKKLKDFYQYKSIYSFYKEEQDTYTARQILFTAGKMCIFSRTLIYNRQLIQFASIPVEFVVRFINVKLITISIAA